MRDSRDYQILFLGLFLSLGVFTRDWSIHAEVMVVAIVTCLGTQQMGQWWEAWSRGEIPWEPPTLQPGATTLEPGFLPGIPALIRQLKHGLSLSNWRSPLITALGLSLLLRVDHWSAMVLGAIVAIGSKFLIRIRGKHIFNPANLGILVTIATVPGAWVSPGQWGEDLWYLLLFLGAGGIVLKRVGRWDTTVAFLGSYGLLELGRVWWLGWTWDVGWHRLTSGSLLLFALFMITDPRSIPDRRGSRIVWAVAVALLTFVLRNQFYLSTAPFWALGCLAPLSPLLDWWGDRQNPESQDDRRFQWSIR